MNKAVPWNINGVGFDAREAAREAARRQGKSLGEWLHDVIADHASDLGVAEEEFGGQDRIDAVTAKLERLSAPLEPRGERLQDRLERDRAQPRSRPQPGRADLDDGDSEHDGLAPRFRRLDSNRSTERARQEPRRSKSMADETELLLDEAIEAMERRTLRAERKTDKAIASVTKILESNESKRDDERDMVSVLTRKMSDMETRIASRVVDDSYNPIKGALARLEARLETLSRRPQTGAQPVLGAALSVVPTSVPQSVPMSAPEAQPGGAFPARAEDTRPARVDDSIQRLETKLNSILDAVMSNTAAPDQNRARRPVGEPMKRGLGDAIADIADRQRGLDSSGQRRREEASIRPARDVLMSSAAPAPDRMIGGLQGDIAALATKIEEMRRDMARAAVPKPKDAAATQIEDLRAEVADMAKIIVDRNARDVVPKQIAEMTTAVEAMRRDLARRDDPKLAEVASRTDLDGLRSDLAGITETLSDLAPRGTVMALEDAIRTLTTRIEASRKASTRESVLPLEEIVGDLRRAMDEIVGRDTIGAIEREVRTIGTKLRDLNGVDVSALAKLQEQTEEIRKLVATAAANPLAVERIERQVASLAERLDRQPHAAARDSQALRRVTTEIRAMIDNPPGAALFDKIERRLEGLTAKVDLAVDEAVEARKVAEQSRLHFDTVQEQLVARLGADRPQTADMRSLETLVRDLSDRMESVRAPDASNHAIEALQDQIVQLSHRFERTDGDLSALSGIERSMQDLFTHLEETRASVETSAARAARQALENAMQKGSVLDTGAAREIASLKVIQEEADHRTHATLTAVHDTLDKVVTRLSSMESDIAKVRTPSKVQNDPREPTPVLRASDLARAGRRAMPDLVLGDADQLNAGLSAPDRPRDERGRRTLDAIEPARRDDAIALGLALRASDRRSPAFGGTRATDRDGDSTHADFIAAARRAAQAAANDPSVVALKRRETPVAAGELRAGLMTQTRDYVASHKKPVLLGIAALFVTLGTLAVMGTIQDTARQIASNGVVVATPRPIKTAAAQPTRAEQNRMDTDRIEQRPQVARGDTNRGEANRADATRADMQASPSRATLADLTPSALPQRPPTPTSEALPGSDPVITGSLPHLPSFAAQAVAAMPIAPSAPSGSLKQLADNGNVGAEYEIASRFAEGRQLTKDYAQAATWFDKAAQQGAAPAQYKLAALYEKGLGVPKDKVKARYWYQKAADAGNPRAMHNLAVLVADGDGKPDYTNAVLWFRRAAEYGVHDSQYNLAILLARGLGTSQSLVQSYQWFAVAAQQNDTDAATKRDEVGSKLSPNDLSVARALAAAFRPKTADVAAVEIDPPAGGWDGASAPSPVKSPRQKLSSL